MESTVAIRRGVATDAPALARFAARTFEETFAHATAPQNMAAHLASAYGDEQQEAELRDPDTITLIAEFGGAIAGFAQVRRWATPECVRGEGAIELRRFYVDRPFHGRGLAGQLMDLSEGEARALGGRRIWLSVFQRNERAVAFYTRRGFARVGAQVFRVGAEDQTDFILVKDLLPLDTSD